ncbi:PaaI family thioesterase [Planctomycetota bacterium]
MIVNKLRSIPSNICNRVHPNCIVCSLGNAKGLHLEFVSGDDGSISAKFSCDEAFEGYPGFLHGGVISSILDGAMGHCIFARGQAAVTVEMATRFRHPVVICQEASVSARIERASRPLYLLEAQIVQTGQVKATATGKFLDQPQLLIQNRGPRG